MRCEAVRLRLLGASLFSAGHGNESLFVSLDELYKVLAYGLRQRISMTDLMLVLGLVPSGLEDV